MVSLKDRLTEILIKNRIISQVQLDEAIEVQTKKGGRLSDIIIDLKMVKESDLNLSLSEGLSLPLIDLKRFRMDPEIIKIIPANIARAYQIIPISKIGDSITLAMADPLNIFAIDHVEALTGYKINPIISSSLDIIAAIDMAYPDSTKDIIGDMVKEMSVSSIELVKEEKEKSLSDMELGAVSQEAPVIKITDLILEDGVKRRASDILIEPFEKKVRVRFRIDGMLLETQNPPKNLHSSIVSRLKVMSMLNIAEHRLPQDGRFKAKLQRKEVDFRVSILPSSFGEKVAIRILDKTQATLDIDKLGFSKEVTDPLRRLSKLPHGMILVCGPTGSGKTTTLYSMVKLVDTSEKNIVTVEDPVEYQLEGINQVNVRQDVGLTFASALRAILRQDPNIIMIGEIRDLETVDIAIKSALTGHLVFSTLHTTTACGSIVRLVNMGIEPYMINSSLVCVVAQRLLRKVCTHCKEEYTLSSEMIENMKLALPDPKKAKFFRGKGCSHCLNLGYSGRVGIAEVLILSASIREMILKGAQEHMIKRQARKEGMNTLREDGLRAALAGQTTLEEVLRVTARDE
ncbi:MAG: ATPase, T2SS/T4P/T4SS family [Candidatus Omnitrophica bacterium]|jgi:type IV pilus assembly protein PilB|nr:Flp pilus assembly complex ATPase component TadA [Candidatus Omnitrophota bacterium]MDD5078814.1 ATPase, T2SS/T4P/T4SS family [Candidatus Omnitrophota bacterium]